MQNMRKIYQEAHKAFIWLGERLSDSDCAIDFTHFLDGMNQTNTEAIRFTLQDD